MTVLAKCFETLSVLSVSAAFVLVIILFLREIGVINFNLLTNRILPINSNSEVHQKGIKGELKTFLTISALVISSRIFIYLIGYMGVLLIKNQGIDIIGSFESLWNRWDSPHYISIAKDWYQNSGDPQNFIVFYPLYPLLIKLLALINGNYFLSAVLCSNISLILACFYLQKLVKTEFEESFCVPTIKYLLIFPFSFFFGLAYTESLFMALSIMTFYYLRKKDWVTAGICGMLAALTRNFGLLLLIPALVEYLIVSGTVENLKKKRFLTIISHFFREGIYIFLMPIGFVIYLYINKSVTGDWFRFLTIQKNHWNNSFGFFGENVRNHFMNALTTTWDSAARVSLWIPQVFIFIITILFIFYGLNKLRVSYLAYMVAYLLVTFSPTWLLSGPRYISALFPIYLLLGLASRNKIADNVATVICSMLLCFYTVAFALGNYVM
ncbi:MAG: glycosyltransferase family 39 protein [Clostridia bacterium]|nr:glycosyltransferase family 39 protein [Clostridia bacterium]